MLKAIITYLNLKLELLNYFDLTRCLVELKEIETENGTLKQPVEYISNGEFDVINFDEFNGVSYWRLRDEPSTDRTETQKYRAGAKNNIETTIPLRLVFAVPRTKLTEDDAYSFDRIRQTMLKQFAIDDEVLRNQLGAISVRITQVGSNSNPKEVWEEETEGTGTFEPKYETVFGSIDVDVVIISDHECLPTECDDVESDIIRAFDWCGNTAVTVGRLTQDQQDCISAYICGVADPVQIQVNGVNTETAEAGTTYDQEIHNSVGTDVGTAANPSIVGDSRIGVNGNFIANTPAEVDKSIDVHNTDGDDVGSLHGGIWEVQNSTVTVNSSAFDSVVAEGTIDVPVQYENGTPVGTITGGVVEIPDPVSCPSVSLAVSDEEPEYGETITLTATPSNITPDNYIFYAINSLDEIVFIYQGASNSTNWVANSSSGEWTIFVDAVESDTIHASDCVGIEIQPDLDAEAYLNQVGIANDSTVYFASTPQEITGSAIWAAVNDCIISLKAADLYSTSWTGYDGTKTKIDILYLDIGDTAAMLKWNAANPADTDAAFRKSYFGGLSYAATGVSGNGTNAYVNTHYNPKSELDSSDVAMGLYSRTASVTNLAFDAAVRDGSDYRLSIATQQSDGDSIYEVNNNVNNGQIAVSDGQGMYQVRLVGLFAQLLKDGFSIDTSTSTQDIPDDDLFMFARNYGGADRYSSREICFFYLVNGTITTPQETAIREAAIALQTALNRNV